MEALASERWMVKRGEENDKKGKSGRNSAQNLDSPGWM
jgi:hypothetical protein